MNDSEYAELADWIAAAGLAGGAETALVAGVCERLCGLGVPIARAAVFIDTLHPTYEGRIFGWQAKAGRQRIPENDDTNLLVRRARGRNGHKHTKQREQQPVCKALDPDGVPPI